MRIVHIVHSLDPDYGGPPAVAVRLAAAQAAQGHDTRVISFGEPGDFVDSPQYAKVPGRDAVRFEFIDTGRGPAARAIGWHARRPLRNATRNADFVHLHGLWSRIVLHGAHAADAAQIPYAIRPAGTVDPWSLRQRPLKKRVALALAWRRILERARFVHMLNEDERKLAGPVIPRATMKVFPNGVFLEELEPLPSADAFFGQHPELQGRRFVLFLSRLHYKKGLDLLADAFAGVARRLGDVDLVVAGPDQGARAGFERAVERLGISNRVHVVGPLYGESKIAALTAASCFCLPSRQEGFSVAITEALAVGCPVVVTAACHYPEVTQHGAGFETTLDASDIGARLDQILGDSALATQMSRSARALVRERFTWPAIARLLVDEYR